MTVKELFNRLKLARSDAEIEIIDGDLNVNAIDRIEIVRETQGQSITEYVRIYL